MIYFIDTNFYLFQQAVQDAKIAEMEQKLIDSNGPLKVEVPKKKSTVNKNIPGPKVWSSKIEETGKFKIGPNDSAFNSIGSRYAYIKILIDAFTVSPDFAGVSFEELFNPVNSYGNFQHLLNSFPVPSDHEGFYVNDDRKKHLLSSYLSSP